MVEQSLQIADLSIADVPAVVQLELQAGLSSYGEAGLQRLLTTSTAIFKIAVLQSDNDCRNEVNPLLNRNVVGFASASLVIDELEIDNLVISASLQRQGIGKRIFHELLRTAWEKGARQVFLEVRKGNTGAVNFYSLFRFEQVGIRRQYYRDPVEDALILRLELGLFQKKLEAAEP